MFYKTVKSLRSKCCLILIVALFLSSCGNASAGPESLNIVFKYDANFWNYYDLSHTSFPTQEDFEELTRQYIMQIRERLGIADWLQPINPKADTLVFHLNIIGETSSTTILPSVLENEAEVRISLNRKYLTLAGFDAALAHELTHMMCPSFSQSLEEGLCNYMDVEIGANNFYRQLGWNIQEIYKLIFEYEAQRYDISAEEITEIINLVGKSGHGYPYVEFVNAASLNNPKTSLWFDYSSSFVRYLLENYGTECTANLIRCGEDESAYQKYFHKTLDELREEWISYMNALESEHSLEELMEADEEFYSAVKLRVN